MCFGACGNAKGGSFGSVCASVYLDVRRLATDGGSIR